MIVYPCKYYESSYFSEVVDRHACAVIKLYSSFGDDVWLHCIIPLIIMLDYVPFKLWLWYLIVIINNCYHFTIVKRLLSFYCTPPPRPRRGRDEQIRRVLWEYCALIMSCFDDYEVWSYRARCCVLYRQITSRSLIITQSWNQVIDYNIIIIIIIIDLC